MAEGAYLARPSSMPAYLRGSVDFAHMRAVVTLDETVSALTARERAQLADLIAQAEFDEHVDVVHDFGRVTLDGQPGSVGPSGRAFVWMISFGADQPRRPEHFNIASADATDECAS